MTSFDPAAATAAYLAELPAQTQARAVAYTHGNHWLLLWDALVSAAAAVVILKLGILWRTQARLERSKPRPFLTALVLAWIFLALDFILELPWASYAQWWREKAYGLNNQTWAGWAADTAVTSLISIVLTGLLIAGVYWLMRRSPRAWPAWGGLLTGVFVAFTIAVAPVFIMPLINHYEPAPPGPVRDAVAALGRANGVPTDKIYIYNGSKQSNRYTANVAGLFGTARVAMSDAMFAKGADIHEVRAVVGHEMGHYVHGHVLYLTLFFAVLVAAGMWAARALFPLAQRWLGVPAIAGVEDPAGLPVLMALFAVLGLIATPLVNTVSRIDEAQADAFSLQRAREPDGMARALVKTVEYRAASPSRLEEVLFYDHPSVERRIRRAMDWKAAHLPLTADPAGSAGSARKPEAPPGAPS